MLLGLRTVVYNVPPDRLDEAKAWYTRAAGVEPYFDQPFYVGFSVGGFELGLDPDPSAGAPGPGGTGVFWGTADITAEVARLTDAGAVVVDQVKDVGGEIKVAVLADPFGNHFGLIQNPHFDPAAVR